MKKGFTLIELLAVIIILAVIALIATPVIIKVVDSAKESARKSSVAGYADAIRLTVNEKMFENKGTMPTINEEFLNNVTYQGENVTCGNVINSNSYGIVLSDCTVETNINLYCYLSGKVYSCDDTTFTDVYTDLISKYTDNSGANYPDLYNNMIPVYYNGTSWVYADVYNDAWYDYDLKKWANAVVLVSSPSKTYSAGDAILMDDIAQMYVWIPRYTYTIFNGNNETVSAQEINLTFESETNSSGTVICTDNVTNSTSSTSSQNCTDATNGSIINGTSTYTHPAFTFGTTEINGFWVGKFETTGTIDSITIKPNLNALRGIILANFFTGVSNIATQYSINADSHVIKNIEWGAVAYLKQSKYGLGNVDIGMNNSSTFITGCGAAAGSASSTECNTYETPNGMLASTTGNIYGIYDMSGGMLEYVMGDMMQQTYATPQVGYNTYFYSGFNGRLSDGQSYTGGTTLPNIKYYDYYSNNSSLAITRGKLGDATKETKGWYSDSTSFIYGNYPWFTRGEYNSRGNSAGIFAAGTGTGYSDGNKTTRVVLVSE